MLIPFYSNAISLNVSAINATQMTVQAFSPAAGGSLTSGVSFFWESTGTRVL